MELAVSYFKVLSQHSLARTEENHGKLNECSRCFCRDSNHSEHEYTSCPVVLCEAMPLREADISSESFSS
jgi:hypothetical protein